MQEQDVLAWAAFVLQNDDAATALGLSWEAAIDESIVEKQFRKLSRVLHPDKVASLLVRNGFDPQQPFQRLQQHVHQLKHELQLRKVRSCPRVH